MFTCPICNLFGGNSFASVLRHIGEVHRFDPGLTIRCGIERCPQTYSNYESFRSHVYRKHRHVLHSTVSTTDASRSESSIDISNADTNNSIDNIKDAGAKFVLKVREEYRIPQSTLNKIINDVKGLWVTALDSIKAKVKKEVESDVVGALLKCFEDSFPLDGLETEHLQLKYYKRHFNYLVSLALWWTISIIRTQLWAKYSNTIFRRPC